jgi:choline dehydrogenase-like flavoprotein
VSRIVVTRGEVTLTCSADVVVVSAGAINSAALLLRPASDRHPRGLANAPDTVGRHYMGHVNSVLMAISRCPNPTVFQKTLGLNDFYFGSPEWESPMGHISFVGKEDLPDPDNRVSLDREGNIVLAYRPNNETSHQRLTAKLEHLMKQQTKCHAHGHECHEGLFSRNLFLGQRIPLAGVAHQNGTIRFGHDPRSSALDVHCRAHEVDNLYVVDGSFFPSSAAVNPALTIMANALRVADHLKTRLGVRSYIPTSDQRNVGM